MPRPRRRGTEAPDAAKAGARFDFPQGRHRSFRRISRPGENPAQRDIMSTQPALQVVATPATDSSNAERSWLASNWGLLAAIAALIVVLLLPPPAGLPAAGCSPSSPLPSSSG